MITANPISFVTSQSFGIPTASVVGRNSFEAMLDDDIESVFLNVDEFAITISYEHYTKEVKSYSAIINTPFNDISITGTMITTQNIELILHESKLIRMLRSGDSFVAKGIKYSLKKAQPDGVGTILIYGERYGQSNA